MGLSQLVVRARKIASRVHELRVWPDGVDPDASEFIAAMNLIDMGGGVCQASMAMGNLSDEVNVEIGLKALELGFHQMRFSTLKDSRATRWATKVGEDEHLNYFSVDLVDAERIYRG